MALVYSLLLLLGGCEASRLRRFTSEGELEAGQDNQDSGGASVQYAEKFDPKGSEC